MNLLDLSIIQGGMGVSVSTPFLAKKCSISGNGRVLGTVSGVGAEHILARNLQLGDLGGHYRRALEHFTFPEVAERIIKEYFVPRGIPSGKKFKNVPRFSFEPNRELIELTVAASFALVWLAKEGNDNPISVNYLEKVRIPHVYHLTGAMLAGVDYVTMGAGITLQIPGVLDAIAEGGIPIYRVFVEGMIGTKTIGFDPRAFFGAKLPELHRPGFLPIISTDALAKIMDKKMPNGSIQGFVVELPTAGGHNASPRGKVEFDEIGQPIYGQKDKVDFGELVDLGIPFWIGGSFASPAGLARAKSLGAVGTQDGTIYALSNDSGLVPLYRTLMRRLGYRGELVIRTDAKASSAGIPFKVVQLPCTQSDPAVFKARKRVCDLSILRVPYQKDDGEIGFRCSGMTGEGVRCLCNGLFSAGRLGNLGELPIFTLGDDVSFLPHLMKDEDDSYSVADATRYLLSV